MRPFCFALVLLATCPLLACREQSSDTLSKPRAAAVATRPLKLAPLSVAPPSLAVEPRFVDVARESGINFTFYNDEVEKRFFLPEVMGGGVGWIDFDRDGELDLYFANGAPLDASEASAPPQVGPPQVKPTQLDRLFRRSGDQFQDVSAAAIPPFNDFGQGVSIGDFDADGFPDIYICNYGPNVLLRNNGDGTFQDVTQTAGVGDPLWGSSAIWVDLNEDALLDLYVVNYLDVTLANSRACEYDGKPGYCGPGNYDSAPDRVFRSNGDGTFTECAETFGLVTPSGKGLAIAVADFNEDLRPEIYVANDMEDNQLYTRRPSPEPASLDVLYHDVARSSGCAVSGEGNAEASMGVSCADFDGDGLLDIFLTHYYAHKNTLYHNLGGLLFEDDSRRTRIAATSFEYLGFGTVAFDFELDGDTDLFIANGHVLGPLQTPNEMRPQLLHNEGKGVFADASETAGDYFRNLWLGRSAAGADYDHDGDLDLVVTHLHRPIALLRNDTPRQNHFLGLALTSPSRIPPLGGRIVLHSESQRRVVPIVGGGSYLASSDSKMLLGLGASSQPVNLEIHWPSGHVETFSNLAVDRYYRIEEGKSPEPLLPTATETSARSLRTTRG